MIRRLLTTAIVIASIALSVNAKPLASAEDLAWSITLHPKALAQSQVGKAWSTQVSELHDEWNEKQRLITESLGIDLWQTCDTIVLFNDDYEEGAFAGVASLGPTAGNIEGAILSVPGYQSEMLAEETILNITPWEHRGRDADRLFSAVVRLQDGQDNYFVAGLEREQVEDLIGRLRDGRTDLNLSKDDASALMTMHAYRAVPKRSLRGPQAGLLGMLTAVDIRVAEGEQLTATLSATVENTTRARQLTEMARGWTTFLTMMAGFNEQAAPTHEVLAKIAVSNDGEQVRLNLSCPPQALIDAIRNLAVDKPFDRQEVDSHGHDGEN